MKELDHFKRKSEEINRVRQKVNENALVPSTGRNESLSMLMFVYGKLPLDFTTRTDRPVTHTGQ